MTNRTIPEGWAYDEGDPSVGIFGHSWVHEACEWKNGEQPVVYDREWSAIFSGSGSNRTVMVTTILDCSGCGEEAFATEEHWDPED